LVKQKKKKKKKKKIKKKKKKRRKKKKIKNFGIDFGLNVLKNENSMEFTMEKCHKY